MKWRRPKRSPFLRQNSTSVPQLNKRHHRWWELTWQQQLRRQAITSIRVHFVRIIGNSLAVFLCRAIHKWFKVSVKIVVHCVRNGHSLTINKYHVFTRDSYEHPYLTVLPHEYETPTTETRGNQLDQHNISRLQSHDYENAAAAAATQ